MIIHLVTDLCPHISLTGSDDHIEPWSQNCRPDLLYDSAFARLHGSLSTGLHRNLSQGYGRRMCPKVTQHSRYPVTVQHNNSSLCLFLQIRRAHVAGARRRALNGMKRRVL